MPGLLEELEAQRNQRQRQAEEHRRQDPARGEQQFFEDVSRSSTPRITLRLDFEGARIVAKRSRLVGCSRTTEESHDHTSRSRGRHRRGQHHTGLRFGGPGTGQAARLHRVEVGRTCTAKKTEVGELRAVVRQPTRTLDELEMHITTLNPHTASHPPHTHPNEEMVIVKEGTLQAHVNGREIVVAPGSACCSSPRCSRTPCRTSATRRPPTSSSTGRAPGRQDEADPEAALRPQRAVVSEAARLAALRGARGGAPASAAAPRAWRSASARAAGWRCSGRQLLEVVVSLAHALLLLGRQLADSGASAGAPARVCSGVSSLPALEALLARVRAARASSTASGACRAPAAAAAPAASVSQRSP